MTTTARVAYSARVADALGFVAGCHREQFRKSTEVPYLAHVLAVASQVWRHGGDEDQAVAALLHDVVEDAGITVPDLEDRFGVRGAAIVAAATDTVVPGQARDASTWRERKQHHLATIRRIREEGDPNGALLVIACDKIDNLGDLVRDLRRTGLGAFDRFNAPADKQANVLWYQGAVVHELRGAVPSSAGDELGALLVQLAELT